MLIARIVTATILTIYAGVLTSLYRHRISWQNESAVIKMTGWICIGYLLPLVLIFSRNDGNFFDFIVLCLFCPVLWLILGVFKRFGYSGPLNLFLLSAMISAVAGLVTQYRLNLYIEKGLLARFIGGERGLPIAVSQFIYIVISMAVVSTLIATGYLNKLLSIIEEKTDALFWGAVSVLLLVLLFVAKKISGSGAPTLLSGSLQPTEIVYKFCFILFLSKYLSRTGMAMVLSFYPVRQMIKEVIILFGLICVFFLVPMLTEMGTALLLFLTFTVLISLISKRWYFIPLGGLTAVIGVFGITVVSARMKERVFHAWLNWQEYISQAGMQPFKAYSAFHGSGIFGTGITNGYPKMTKIASDYVLVAVGEEWGVIGLVLITAGYLLILKEVYLLRTIKPDFRGILLLGLPLTIVVQAFFHISANLGLFVLSGLPLPFISLGGSAYLISFLTVGTIMTLMNGKTEDAEVKKGE
jgi:cell division protein FtsW (lipid II flippase)